MTSQAGNREMLNPMNPNLTDLTAAMAANKQLTTAGDRLLQLALHGGPALMRKAAVGAIGTSDVPFVADPDSIPLVAQVQRRSVPGRLLQLGAVAVPARQLLPIDVGADPVPTWTADGAPVPLARLSSTTTSAASASFTLLLAFTRELLRIGDARARNVVLRRSTRAIVRGDDAGFVSATAADAARPAGILNGRSALGSGSPNLLTDDLSSLVAYVNNGDAVAPVFLVSARGAAFLNASDINAFRLLGITGGTIAGAPALITPAAAENLILVDAAEIAISDDGLDVAQSQNPAIEFLDNPTNSSASGTAANVVSAFQAGAVVLKYVRYLSWALLRDDAVGFLELPIGGSPS